MVGPKMTLKDQRTHEAGTRRARFILIAVPLALLVWAVYDDAYGQARSCRSHFSLLILSHPIPLAHHIDSAADALGGIHSYTFVPSGGGASLTRRAGGGGSQHDDDAMDVVVRDLNAAADALESGDGNATAAATSKGSRKRKDASSLMVRFRGGGDSGGLANAHLRCRELSKGQPAVLRDPISSTTVPTRETKT